MICPRGPDGHAEVPDGQEQLYDAPRPEDTVTPPRYPETVSTCGQPPYSWVSPATMGEVVDYEYMPEWSLSKELMALAIVAAGLDGVIEATYGVDIYRVRFTTQTWVSQSKRRMWQSRSSRMTTRPRPMPWSSWAPPRASPTSAPAATDANARAATVYATQGQIVMVPDYIGKTSMGGDGGRIHPYLVQRPQPCDGMGSALGCRSSQTRETRTP